MSEARELLHNHSIVEQGFLYPDWGQIYEIVTTSLKEDQIGDAYLDLAEEWLLSLAEELSSCEEEFRVLSSPNFYILCAESDFTQQNLKRICERLLRSILDQFGGELEDEGYGKHVVIVFKTIDQYYRYLSYYSNDGENPASGGVCLNYGYTHIATPPITNDEIRGNVLAHELTHALLVNYPIPIWLNEALATKMEVLELGAPYSWVTKEQYQEHLKFWNEETIQKFWSGEIWGESSEGFELSYQLACVLWNKIDKELNATKEEVIEFIKQSSQEDAGEAAFQSVFEHSLQDLVAGFLGEGRWGPDHQYLKNIDGLMVDHVGYVEDVKDLIGLPENELEALDLQLLKPTQALQEFFTSLHVTTLKDLLNISVSLWYQERQLFEQVAGELFSKLDAMEVTIAAELSLQQMTTLFELFADGSWESGSLVSDQSVMYIRAHVLTEMMNPSFELLKVELEGFGGFRCAIPSSEKIDPFESEQVAALTYERTASLGLRIQQVEMKMGELVLHLEQDDRSVDYSFEKIQCSFFAEKVTVFDEEGKQWSLEELQHLAEEYWQGC